MSLGGLHEEVEEVAEGWKEGWRRMERRFWA